MKSGSSQHRPIARALTAIVLLATPAGCSFLSRPRDVVLPITDTVVAIAAGGGCIALATDGGSIAPGAPAALSCVPLAPLALIFGMSAAYGFSRIGSHRADDETAAREQAAAVAAKDAFARSRAAAWESTKTAITAARAGDCEAVRKLGRQVLALDAEFHSTVFVENAAIKRCLTPVVAPPADAAPAVRPRPADVPTPP